MSDIGNPKSDIEKSKSGIEISISDIENGGVPVSVSVWGNEKAPDKGRGQPKSFHNGIILIVICFKLVCQR